MTTLTRSPRRPIPRRSSAFAVWAALVGNILVAVTKFAAAAFAGGSAMMAEGVHSLVDSGNELLLLYGMRRSRARADPQHPLGYGRELYFWSFVVAILIFALGSGVAIFEGVSHILDPRPIESARVIYAVLALSALFDGATWLIALRGFRGTKPYGSLLRAARESKDPPAFMVLFEDSAALIGVAIAFLGTFLSVALERPEIDGVASIVIGLILAATAVVLAQETKGLLIGEAADPAMVAEIVRVAASVEGVAAANGALTVHLAPDQILVALSLEFRDDLAAPAIEACVEHLERRLAREFPAICALFVKPQTGAAHAASVARRFGRG